MSQPLWAALTAVLDHTHFNPAHRRLRAVPIRPRIHSAPGSSTSSRQRAATPTRAHAGRPMKIIVLVIVSLLAATAAYAQFNGCPPGFCSGSRNFGTGGGGFSPNAGAGVAVPTGKVQMVDGASFI